MDFEVALENNMEGRTCAWVLGHPGCFAYGTNPQTALAALPEAIHQYIAWVLAHGGDWLAEEEIAFEVVDRWDVYDIDEDFRRVERGWYSVNAWFQDDWKPLTEMEITRSLRLLAWSRMDLLALVRPLSAETLNAIPPNGGWSIARILQHVGGAEWWYLDRLGLALPWDTVPNDPYERLEVVRERLLVILPQLSGVKQVVGVDSEFWSPRKLLRRAVWHEREHTFHIRGML